jgi:membrane protein required for beta-lactamase induction
MHRSIPYFGQTHRRVPAGDNDGRFMFNNSSLAAKMFYDWFPMLVLIVVWIFGIRQVMRHVRARDTEQKRHNEALEKILANHEARLQKMED